MSSEHPAIRVRNLGKRYTIGGSQEKYLTFREAIVNTAKTPFRMLSSRESPQEFWALKDVSFDVEQGEVVGIIGRNGAGKSTLLKILSRITTPTEGTVDLYGRVGSLLEVGTGFHPELTGRENIFLSGSILGMKKREIDEKLDEIVKFSEIEKFLDTPAKRYSSGMYVRLAFAVAAHLEPEILLVDEVLAVGDAAFQKKCLGKMKQISNEGRTVLFVSHSMPTIENLCPRVIWIQQGQIRNDGIGKEVVADYVNTVNQEQDFRKVGEYTNIGHRRGTGEIQFKDFILLNANGQRCSEFDLGEDIVFKINFKTFKDVHNAIFGYAIIDAQTQTFVTNYTCYDQVRSFMAGEEGFFSVTIPKNPFRVRNYYFYIGIYSNTDIPYDIWDGVGTEFSIKYPSTGVEQLHFSIGRDVALVSVYCIPEIKIIMEQKHG